VVHVLDTSTGMQVSATNLNRVWNDAYALDAAAPDDASGARRYPLAANDMAFVPGSDEAYVTANGSDAVFRATFDALGDVTPGAGPGKHFIDLGPGAIDAGKHGQAPIGVAGAHSHPFAFVLNDVSRNVSAIDLDPSQQKLAGNSAADVRVAQSAALPVDPDLAARNRGKYFFGTGLDRWSFRGQAFGACQVCHFDGLSDNITWYFARGPRQSNSIEGSFATGDPSDQRLFNWSGIFDEAHDFENVLRGLLGGVGALVTVVNTPPSATPLVRRCSRKLKGLARVRRITLLHGPAPLTNPLASHK